MMTGKQENEIVVDDYEGREEVVKELRRRIDKVFRQYEGRVRDECGRDKKGV